jgi:hypothetical protein
MWARRVARTTLLILAIIALAANAFAEEDALLSPDPASCGDVGLGGTSTLRIVPVRVNCQIYDDQAPIPSGLVPRRIVSTRKSGTAADAASGRDLAATLRSVPPLDDQAGIWRELLLRLLPQFTE